MNNGSTMHAVYSIIPALILSSLLITGCGNVRYDNTTRHYSLSQYDTNDQQSVTRSGEGSLAENTKKYGIGQDDGATARYGDGRDENTRVYGDSDQGRRYTIGQYDEATAYYTLKQGNRAAFGSEGKQYRYGESTTTGSAGEGQQAEGTSGRSGEMSMILEITDVLFEFDKAVIRAQYYPELNKWVEFFAEHPEVEAVIEGHADSTGPTSYNQKLSERRARAVVNYLMDKGVAADRLTSRGFGELQPIAPNTTREGRQKNRRVEMKY